MSTQRWRVAESEAGERLDRWAARVLDVPRNQVQRWIRDGLIRVDDATAKPSTTLDAGHAITVDRPPPTDDPRIEPEAGPLTVIHADPHVIAIDKPAGLAMHPGAGRSQGTLAHRLLHHFPEIAGVGGAGRPGIVHRLDLDTTGIVLIARTAESYRALSTAFAERQVDKRYVAIVHGCPRTDRGTIDAPIGRHPRDRQKMAVRPDGRPAVSHWATRARAGTWAAILDLGIDTGRTHQIRVHLKSIGYPLIGDPVYGEARWRAAPGPHRVTLRHFPRPALHARRLVVRHPATGDRLDLESPVADDLRQLWRRLADTSEWPPATRPRRT